jgi:hypothetical protein
MSEQVIGTVIIVIGCAWLIPAGIYAFRELVRMTRRAK